MMTPVRRALVAGGTGLVGGELVALLGSDSRYSKVTSLVRRDVAAVVGVENRVVSFDELDRSEIPPVDDAFCCLGTTRRAAGSDEAFRHVDLDYVLAYAGAAKRAGAVRFLLVSSIGADSRSRFLYLRTKGEAEEGVRRLGFSVVGIVRPSFLVGQRSGTRTGEAAAIMVGRGLGALMVGPLRRYRPIEASAVAAGLVRLAFDAPAGVTTLSSDAIGG